MLTRVRSVGSLACSLARLPAAPAARVSVVRRTFSLAVRPGAARAPADGAKRRRRTALLCAAGCACCAVIYVSTSSRSFSTSSSTSAADPPLPLAVFTPSVATSLANLESLLSSHTRCIPARSSSIRVLSSPDEFYTTLGELAGASQRRVTLSSLYLGTGPHETKLVETLRQSIERHPNLKVDVLLDYLRGTREVGPEKLSSVTALAPLLTAPPSVSSRFALSLLHVPPPSPPTISALRAWFERRFFRGNKTREAVGVHHCKFYCFDDAVIISGANLSDTYFTTRQDRYILIRDSPELAAFYATLVARVRELPFCVEVRSTGGNNDQMRPASPSSPADLRSLTQARLLPLFSPASPAGVGASAFSSTHDTLLFPTIQMGSLDIRHDEALTSKLFQAMTTSQTSPSMTDKQTPSASARSTSVDGPCRPSLRIATGYMNLTRAYTSLLLRSTSPITFLAAARDANGWWGAKGAGRHVPELYAAAAWELLQQAKHAPRRGAPDGPGAQEDAIQLYEWSKPGWSYHAKGMWLSLAAPSAAGASSTATATTGPASALISVAPILTVIGSPNYGARSVQRDSESSLFLLTQPGSPLAARLAEEEQRLSQHARRTVLPEEAKTHPQAVEAVQPVWWIRLASKLVRPYM